MDRFSVCRRSICFTSEERDKLREFVLYVQQYTIAAYMVIRLQMARYASRLVHIYIYIYIIYIYIYIYGQRFMSSRTRNENIFI